MSMYMKIPGLTGNITAVGYKDWNAVHSLTFSAGRVINTTIGQAYHRIRSSSRASEMIITKPVDKSSPQLFTQACVGKALDKIKIELCETANDLSPYAEYILHNVMISSYALYAEKSETPMERLALNFTAIETRYTSYDAKHQSQVSESAKIDIGSKQSIGTHLCRDIQDPTPEGFNIFVATVYGEVAGVQSAPEAVWKAVGSVIINRVKQGIWHRHLTTANVIEHTGFDAFMSPCNIDWDHLDFRNSKNYMHQQFLRAWANLSGHKINHKSALLPQEINVLTHIQRVLKKIYYQRDVTTNANYYYSPQAMPGKTPGFLKHLQSPEKYKIFIPGADESEIKFYMIPANVERAAGAK